MAMSAVRVVHKASHRQSMNHDPEGVVEQARNSRLVYVWMVAAVHEADAGRLVRVGLWELDVNAPEATFIRTCARKPGAHVARLAPPDPASSSYMA
jgi:hypothetical protein